MSKPGKGSFLLLHHSSVQVGAWKEEAQILSCLPDKANVLSITPCYVPLVSLKHAAVMAIWGPFVEKQPQEAFQAIKRVQVAGVYGFIRRSKMEERQSKYCSPFYSYFS